LHYTTYFNQIVAAELKYNGVQNITNSNRCPPWFVFNNNSTGKGYSHCECKKDFRDIVICDEKLQESYLDLSHCMTYNSSSHDVQESDAISFGGCPYFYYDNIVKHRYIALPQNISDLNDVFCTPLNRHGLLCRDCIDGFGPSIVSIGYVCANCTEVDCFAWHSFFLITPTMCLQHGNTWSRSPPV